MSDTPKKMMTVGVGLMALGCLIPIIAAVVILLVGAIAVALGA